MTKRKDAEARVTDLEKELAAVKHDLSIVGEDKRVLGKELLTYQAKAIELEAALEQANEATRQAEAKAGYVPSDMVEECILFLDGFIVESDSDQARSLADQARGHLIELQRRRAFEVSGKTGVSA